MNKEKQIELENLHKISKDFKRNILKDFERIEELFNVNEDKSVEINFLRNNIDKYYERTSDIDVEIHEKLISFNATKKARKDFEEQKYEFETIFIQKSSFVESKVRKNTNDIETLSKSTSNISLDRNDCVVKLPELKLKEFSGDPQDWAAFWQSFACSIDSNVNLSKVIKFTYLKSLLCTRALRLVDSIPTTEDGYNTAIEILKARFDKPSQSRESIHKLFSIVDEIKYVNQRNMQLIYDDLLTEVIKLKHAGVKEETFDQAILFRLMPKLPEKIQNKLIKSPEQFSLTAVLNMMANIIDLEQAKLSFKNVSDDKKTTFRNPPATRMPNQHTTMLTDSKLTCRICNKNHVYYKCNLPVSSKLEIVKRNKLCFKCCGKNHSASECRNKTGCQKCKGGHNSSLCWKVEENSSAHMVSESAATDDSSQTLNPEIPPFSMLFNKEPASNLPVKNHVFLATALVNISNPTNGHSKQARVLFDSGSQRSFINKSLAKELNLPIHGSENMTVNTFGDRSAHGVKTQIVSFDIIAANFSKNIQARTMETICSPLTNLPVSDTYLPEISNLKLADPMILKQRNLSVDVLIGGDFYWVFMNGNVFKTGFGAMAINTPLGIVLSGNCDAQDLKSNYHTYLS